MAATRRTGTESSATRARLLDETERLMRTEGYAAVSSRRVASEAGVTGALVHYYFPTLDDLFLAAFRRGAERNLERHARALESDQPLRALWEFSLEPAGAVLFNEYMALANHRKAIRREIVSYAKRFRKLQLEVLGERLAGDDVPPEVALVLLSTVARGLVTEAAMGNTVGHAETLAFAERWLDRLEGAKPPKRTAPAPKTTRTKKTTR